MKKAASKKQSFAAYRVAFSSLLCMALCTMCFCSSSWAWFTVSKNCRVNDIRSAENFATVFLNEIERYPIDGEKNKYSFDVTVGVPVPLTIAVSGDSTTENGHIAWYYSDNSDTRQYQDIASRNTSLTITPSREGTLIVEIFWGEAPTQNS